MRLLTISHNYPLPHKSSYGHFVQQQMQAMVQRGHDVTVFVPLSWRLWKDSFLKLVKKEERNGVHIILSWIPTVSNHRYIYWMYAVFMLLLTFVLQSHFRKKSFDAIYTGNAFPEGLAAVWLAKTFKIPCVVCARGELINYPQENPIAAALCRYILKRADYVLGVSDALVDEAKRLTCDDDLCASVLHEGLDLSLFSALPAEVREQLRAQHLIPPERVMLGYVGALTADKGIPELIHVFKKLANQRDVGLILVGAGAELETAKTELARCSVIAPGQVSYQTINNYLNCMDIFVFPSHFEGLPNAVAEAMAVGLPTVASRAGGIPELITAGENGFLVEGSFANDSKMLSQIDEADLEEKLLRLIDSADMRRQMGARGREMISSRNTWAKNAHTLEAIVSGLL